MGSYATKDTELGGEVTAIQSSRVGEVENVGLVNDAVFGQAEEGAPNYRNVSVQIFGRACPCPYGSV